MSSQDDIPESMRRALEANEREERGSASDDTPSSFTLVLGFLALIPYLLIAVGFLAAKSDGMKALGALAPLLFAVISSGVVGAIGFVACLVEASRNRRIGGMIVATVIGGLPAFLVMCFGKV